MSEKNTIIDLYKIAYYRAPQLHKDWAYWRKGKTYVTARRLFWRIYWVLGRNSSGNVYSTEIK